MKNILLCLGIILSIGCGGDEEDVCKQATKIAGDIITPFCDDLTSVCCACKCFFQGKGFDPDANTCICTGEWIGFYTCPKEEETATNCVNDPNECRSNYQSLYDLACRYGPPL